MPHSGGGGSSSGGASGSSRKVTKIHISAAPFIGCIAYAVYDRHGHSHLVYTNSENYKEEKTNLGFAVRLLIMGTVFLCAMGAFIFGIFYLNARTHLGANPPSVDIIDSQDLVTEEEEATLKEALESFRDQTGITPAIEFTTEDTWIEDFSDIEAYAYDQYLKLFEDESHLLIIYSYGAEDKDTGAQEFQWHSMWGDDLRSLAGATDENWLVENLQLQLSNAKGHDVPSVIADVFRDFTEELLGSNKTMKTVEAVCAAFLLLIGAPMFIYGIKLFRSESKERKKKIADGIKTYRITGEPQALKCEYCGCTYYKGTVSTCPHCGASLKE